MRLMWPVAVSGLLVAGCSPPAAEVNALREKISDLEAQVLLLKYPEEPLDVRVASLEAKLSTIAARGSITFASLTPGSSGYSVSGTEMGPFLVSLGDIEARGKGSKVVIAVGNLTAARFQGVNMTVVYGADKKSDQAGQAFTVQYAHPGDLPSGSWTSTSVILPDLKPEELGVIQVMISPSVVHMR